MKESNRSKEETQVTWVSLQSQTQDRGEVKQHLYTYPAIPLFHRVVLTLGKEQETFSLPLAEIKEGQMVAIGGPAVTKVSPNDPLCVQFFVTLFKYL